MVKLDKNEYHVASKIILFLIYVIFNMYMLFCVMFGLIFGSYDLVNKIASVMSFIAQGFITYKLYHFFFRLNGSKMNKISEQRKIVQYKQLNLLEEIK